MLISACNPMLRPIHAARYGQAAGDAMRKTLHHRYSLITYHYSNAHRMYAEGRPAYRPMLMDL